MRVSPKYINFRTRVKEQQIELSCFTDDDINITEKCKFELIDDNKDIKIVKNIIKVNANPKHSINKISVLYKNGDVIEQDYVMVYID